MRVMRFEFSAEEWHFVIEVLPAKDYKPDSKFSAVSSQELAAWRQGEMGFYHIVIVSKRMDSDEDEMIHYASGVLLPQDPEELQDELEGLLDDAGYLEHILKHWELGELDEGPEWRKG